MSEEAYLLVFQNAPQNLPLNKLLNYPLELPEKLQIEILIKAVCENHAEYIVNACFLEMLQFMFSENKRMAYLYNLATRLNSAHSIGIINQHIERHSLGQYFKLSIQKYEFLIPEYPFEPKKKEQVLINLYPIWSQIREQDVVHLKKGISTVDADDLNDSTDVLNSEYEGSFKMTYSTATLTIQKGTVTEISLKSIQAYTWQEMENPSVKIKRKPVPRASLSAYEDDSVDVGDTVFSKCKSLCLLVDRKMINFFPILPSEIPRIDKILQTLIEKKSFEHNSFLSLILYDKLTEIKRALGVKANLANDNSKILVNQKQIIQCLHSLLKDQAAQPQYLLLLVELSCRSEIQVLRETINVLKQYWTITYTEQRQLNVLSCLARILSALAQSSRYNVELVKDWLIHMEDTISPYQQ
eukprot:NODE_254_length_11700_cov_0.671580.p2 type:complete len:412 gc:universal NODE_254_length_11700_cov_0.671580:10043-11278(+)